MVSKTTQIGNRGEDIAMEWLRKNGYMIVARNWRFGSYELDIVAQKGFSLHIVEVKTRRRNSWETPEDAMTPSKIRSFLKAANIYLANFPTPLEVQLDFIAIDMESDGSVEVRYIPNAVHSRW
ncbi:MAG: YraN family protein [Rikenellaceae bacterium]